MSDFGSEDSPAQMTQIGRVCPKEILTVMGIILIYFDLVYVYLHLKFMMI